MRREERFGNPGSGVLLREYAKAPGVSYRENSQVRKRDVIYLGRVINKEHHIFCNSERGIFTFDPETGTFGKANETYISDLKSDGRKNSSRFWRFLFRRHADETHWL